MLAQDVEERSVAVHAGPVLLVVPERGEPLVAMIPSMISSGLPANRQPISSRSGSGIRLYEDAREDSHL